MNPKQCQGKGFAASIIRHIAFEIGRSSYQSKCDAGVRRSVPERLVNVVRAVGIVDVHGRGCFLGLRRDVIWRRGRP